MESGRHDSALFDRIYTAAKTGDENRLNAIYALYKSLHVRRGIHTPLNLLAEEGWHKAVLLIINKFGGSLIDATIGWARGGFARQVDKAITQGVEVTFAVEGFTTRDHHHLAQKLMKPYAEQPEKLQLLKRAAYVGALLGGKETEDVLVYAHIPVEQIELDILQLAIAGRFELIKKILTQRKSEFIQAKAHLDCTMLEGAAIGGHFTEVDVDFTAQETELNIQRRIFLAAIKGGHHQQAETFGHHFFQVNKMEVLRIYAEQGNMAKVEEMILNADIPEKNKMFEHAADTFKYGHYFTTTELALRSLAFIQNNTIRDRLGKSLEITEEVRKQANKLNAAMKKYQFDYKLALAWLTTPKEMRELFFSFPSIATAIFTRYTQFHPDLFLMIAMYLNPELNSQEIINLFSQTTFYIYKEFLISELKKYSDGYINFKKHKSEAKKFIKSCLLIHSLPELITLLMQEIAVVLNMQERNKYAEILIKHYNRLQALSNSHGNKKNYGQDLFNDICQFAESGDSDSLAQLVASGGSVNTRRVMRTPIDAFEETHDRQAVNLLLKFGGKINNVALIAAQQGTLSRVDELLALGASIDIVIEGLAMVNHPALNDYLKTSEKNKFAVRGAARGGQDKLVDELIDAVMSPLEECERTAVSRMYAISIQIKQLRLLAELYLYAVEGYALAKNIKKIHFYTYSHPDLAEQVAAHSVKVLARHGDLELVEKHKSFVSILSEQSLLNNIAEGLAAGGNINALENWLDLLQQNSTAVNLNQCIYAAIRGCILGGYHHMARTLIYKFHSRDKEINFTFAAIDAHIQMGNFLQVMEYVRCNNHSEKALLFVLMKYAQQALFADNKCHPRLLTMLAFIDDASVRDKFVKAAQELQNMYACTHLCKDIKLSATFIELSLDKSLLKKAEKLYELKNKYQLNMKQVFAFLLLEKDVLTWILETAADQLLPFEILSTINFTLFSDYNAAIVFFLKEPIASAEIDDLYSKMVSNTDLIQKRVFFQCHKFLLQDLNFYSNSAHSKSVSQRISFLKKSLTHENSHTPEKIVSILQAELEKLTNSENLADEKKLSFYTVLSKHHERFVRLRK